MGRIKNRCGHSSIDNHGQVSAQSRISVYRVDYRWPWQGPVSKKYQMQLAECTDCIAWNCKTDVAL